MTIQVIGAGFGRTGTASLKDALERLGFRKCYHMFELDQEKDEDLAWLALARGERVDFDALFQGYRATVDWPSCNFWREQLAWYPDARVILSERDPQRWYESVMNTIYPASVQLREAAQSDPLLERRARMVFDVIWNPLFQDRMDDRDHVMDVYLRHNQQVKDEVPAGKLLVFDPAQGWAPLCDFLDVPVPEEPFPRVNSTEEFLQAAKERAAALAGQRDR